MGLKFQARQRNAIVICDRYAIDLLADAMYDMSFTGGLFEFAERAVTSSFPSAKKALILDIPPEVALERKADIPGPDYVSRRRIIYRALAKKHGIPIINSTAITEGNLEELAEVTASLLGRGDMPISEINREPKVRNS